MGLFKGSMTDDCDKAAHILKSFISKGKIPSSAIASAKGIAIFNGFRAGMWLASTSGSGVVLARLPDGSWSGPSAFSVRTGNFGIVLGVDVFDCVCLLNTDAAVEAYTKPEVNLGAGIEVAAGPANVSSAEGGAKKPVWVYTKSRGLYGGVTVEGTVIREKAELNGEFYGRKVSCEDILGGRVEEQGGEGKWPRGAEKLMEMVKMAEGKVADVRVVEGISSEPTMGDLTA